MTRAVGWQRRGCTSKSPYNTSGKMPQHWHQAFPEGTRGTGDGLSRLTREGRPGVHATTLLPAYWAQVLSMQPTGRACQAAEGHPDRGWQGAYKGGEGRREKGGPARWDEVVPGAGNSPSPRRPSVRPPGRDLCSAAGGSRGRGADGGGGEMGGWGRR